MHAPERGERDAARALGRLAGFECFDVGGAACLAIPAIPDVPMVNHVVGLGEDEPATDEALTAIAMFYADIGARFYTAVTPNAKPADIRDRLLTRGYTRGYDWMKFGRDVEPVPTAKTDLDVRVVEGGAAADDFATVVLAAYGLPPVVHDSIRGVPTASACKAYIAYDGDAPAAAGAVFVSGDTAWLGFAGTRPEHRGRGGQSAILAARFAYARERGATTAVTETGVMAEGRPSSSYRNLVRAGFEELYVRENYLSPAR